MMEGSHGSCGGSRRRFLKTAAATGAGAAMASADLALAAQAPTFPTITLGKTGQTVTRLGMGTSWDVEPSFVQLMLAAGVKYIDTAEGYERGKSEKTIGEVLERTGKRKDVYLVTKTHAPRVADGAGAFLDQKVAKSLESLRTDYIDSFYLHGVTGDEIKLLKSPEVKAAFEALKKSGKIRYCGLSCHDKALTQVIEAAAEVGWLDQIMIQYNFRTMTSDDLKRAVDAASKAKLGIVAMKTQGGAREFKAAANDAPEFNRYMASGFKKEQSSPTSGFTPSSAR
jgi:aryl-alcohol dehydrogenase-like predicted oxidoreductase